MHLDDCYRLLDLDASASEEEVKRAHRDLTKVWHPDRFAQDPSVQRKAQEKLKSINEAYDTIRAARGNSQGRKANDAGEGRRRERRHLLYAFAAAGLALLILVRRPTPGGLLIAALLFFVAFFLIFRMR